MPTTAPRPRVAMEYADYASPEAVQRESGATRYRILNWVARGYVRSLLIAGDRLLVHRGDVRQLAAEQHRSTQAPTQRPAA